VRTAIRRIGARLVFLPKYSPDLNPIEQVFAKLKSFVRKQAPRTLEAVSTAMSTPLRSSAAIPLRCSALSANADRNRRRTKFDGRFPNADRHH